MGEVVPISVFRFGGKKQSQLHICVGHARAGHVTIVLSKNGRICLTSQKPLKSRHYVYLTFAVEALETMFFCRAKVCFIVFYTRSRKL